MEAFRLVREEEIGEVQAKLQIFEHVGCAARVMHIACDDPENLFCLSFRTYPESSDGVAHILEHTVLCGSEKFPVRDPFFSMHRRSLHTFMNALTGSDFTCYPAASQVEKDFYNLFEVYLDAVFFPKLDELSFLQEGHRLEVKQGDGIVNKGVVFNEMKGAMASPDSRMWQALLENLMPDLTYAKNSGGDPKEIAEITRKDLLDFHKKYYAPDQCLFFTYGNLPVEKHLAFIEKHVLHKAKKTAEIPPIPTQARWKKPKSVTAPFPSKVGDEPFAVLAWLTTKIADTEDLLGLMLLDSVLTDTDASPLKRALLDSKLCASADAFLDPEISETPYAIVCKGCKKGAAKKIEKVTLDTLEKICKEGIDPELAKSALHQLELHRMEITGGRNPFGLTLFMRAALPMQHRCDPADSLKIFSHFEHLEKSIEDPKFLANLAKKYLLDNPHRLTLEMEPDSTLTLREKQAEQKVLEEKEKKIKKKEREKLIADAEALEKLQEVEDDLSCLPQIKLSDVPKQARNLKLHNIGARGPLSCYYLNTFTNHLTYAHALFELPALTEDELMKAELMVTIMPELGAGKRSFSENLAFLHRYTGGLSAYFSLHTLYGEPEQMHPILAIRGKALSRNLPHLFTAMNDIIKTPRFDEKERIKELITQIATGLKSRLTRNAMSYAIGTSLSTLSPGNYLHECMHGLKYYHFVQDLAQNLDGRLELLLAEFSRLAEKLFHGHALDLVLTCSEQDLRSVQENGYFGLDQLPQKSYTPFDAGFTLPKSRDIAKVIAAPVAFVAKSIRTTPAPHFDAPALHLASTLFENKTLHKRIREQGGAYGSGATYSSVTGNFYMTSYRDPNIKTTLDAFNEAIETAIRNKYSSDEIKQAKIGLIQGFDSPIAPGSRGITAYNWMHTGRTLERRQKYRDAILSTNAKSVSDAVEKHLANFASDGHLAALAGKELLEKEKLGIETETI